MRRGRASWTAQGVAFFRALESKLPEDERACFDPLAKDFLGFWLRMVCRSRLRTRVARVYVANMRSGRSAPFIASRTGFIDDWLKRCIDEGFDQMVILGAGYDSRAYRFADLAGWTRVFEVDHPATQKRKTRRVWRVLGSMPEHVTYVPVDFEHRKLEEGLLESGYDPEAKTLFIWEGVTVYLTPEAVDETLSFMARNSGEGSFLVFDYVYQAYLDGQVEGAAEWRTYLEKRGEPPVFGIEEGAAGDFLSRRGFRLVEDVPDCALKHEYLRATDSGKRVSLRAPAHGGICTSVNAGTFRSAPLSASE